MSSSIDDYVISPYISVIEAMAIIDRGGHGIAFICDSSRKVLGVVTDGDIRRYILKNGDLKTSVGNIATTKFISLTSQSSESEQELFMKDRLLRGIPILNEEGILTSIRFANETRAIMKTPLCLPVVIMAGGKGKRLYPYTQVLPKPLIPIGEQTITEHIMQRFQDYGCEEFYLIVNYRKNLIKAYFTEDVRAKNIHFIDEEQPLGTGGGLKLLQGLVFSTFFLSNCDILVDADYDDILDYHHKYQNIATIVCAIKKVVIPYGTIEMNQDGHVKQIHEKPAYSFLTNTGVYLLEPRFLDFIPANTHIDITTVLEKCIAAGEKVGVYPVGEEKWSDMGIISGLNNMQTQIGKS